MIDKWEFENSIGSKRINDLEHCPSFEEIVQSIEKDMKILCVHEIPCDNCKKDGYYRITYCFEISKDLFDLFFNSKNGYRAWYYRSIEQGFEKNSFMIQALTPKLIKYGVEKSIPENKIKLSLKASSSKVWLAEIGKGIESCTCYGEWKYSQDSKIEIYNDCWEILDITKYPYSSYGRTAPCLKIIRIFGGFINEEGEEEDLKPNRSKEIHDWGWT